MGAGFLGATIGEPGKFYKAGDEIHCWYRKRCG